MKHLNLLMAAASLVLSGAMIAGAQTRTEEEMAQIATAFFDSPLFNSHSLNSNADHSAGGNAAVTGVSKSNLRLVTQSSALGVAAPGNETFAVYAPEGGSGYVIVSAQCAQPEVLGFSDRGTFDADHMPPALTTFLQATAGNAQGEHLTTRTDEQVEPLLGDIQFGQSSPMNDLCPVYNGQNTLTGCVAVQMAQVLAYYRYPDHMMSDEMISYSTPTHGLNVTWNTATTTFDWDNILPYYGQKATSYAGDETIGTDRSMAMEAMEMGDYEAVYCTTLWNGSAETLSGKLQLLLTTENDSLICPMGEAQQFELQSRYYYYYMGFALGLSPDVPEGTYRMHLGFLPDGGKTWQLVGQLSTTSGWSIEASSPYLTVEVGQRYFTVADRKIQLDYSDAQAQAVATLLAACAIANRSDFGLTATSSSSPNSALQDYFGYDRGMYSLPVKCYRSVSEAEDSICAELQANRPVGVSGTSSSGGGHGFLIDGYRWQNDLPYYHVNWGWAGYNNGYFLLNVNGSDLAQDSTAVNNYCYGLDLMFNIMPDDGLESPFVFGCDSVTADAEHYMPGDRIQVSLWSIRNYTMRDFFGEITLDLVDESGQSQQQYSVLDCAYNGMTLTYGYPQLPREFILPASLPSGIYTLQVTLGDLGYVVMPKQTQIAVGDVTLGIESLHPDVAAPEAPVYTIDGRRVTGDVSAPGLYLKAGKKYWVR